MKYLISLEQVRLFKKGESVRFPDFFSEPFSLPEGNESFPYNFWQRDPKISKIVRNRWLGEVIFQLSGIRPVRLLFDQRMASGQIDLQAASFSRIVAGVALLSQSFDLTIFSVESSFSVERSGLIVAYGQIGSRCHWKRGSELDPRTTAFKNLGYGSGDSLQVEDCPLIYKN